MKKMISTLLLMISASCIAAINVETTVISSGMEGDYCFVAPSMAKAPNGDCLITVNKLLLTASDVFFDIHEMRSSDGGKTWTAPEVLSDNLRRKAYSDKLDISYHIVPKYHEKSGRLLGVGATVLYQGNHVKPEPRPSDIIYSVFDDEKKVWGKCEKLDLPERKDFYTLCWAGNQRYDLPDGRILVPVYHRNKVYDPARPYSVTVLLCEFNGNELRYIKSGNTLKHDVPRGFYEPSVTYYEGKYYLTLRNDIKGYVAVSNDGLNYSEPVDWKFDDGQPLGNYNTQQHWISHKDGLYLVYTRKTSDNDNVFRNRAPLFIAKVDTEKLCVIRDTEQIVVPNRGARLGNFGITPISDTESWVTVAEWMQNDNVGFGKPGIEHCRKYGSDNSIFIAKIKTGARPTVYLTFDDFFVKQWIEAMPIFEKYGAKATFCVTDYDKYTSEQIAGLKKLKAAGHAIACHSLRHEKAVDYSRQYSLEKYFLDDVKPAIDMMNKDGFYPACFAYPNSQNDENTDRMLLEHFKYLRSGVPYSKADMIFYEPEDIEDGGSFYATGIDSNKKDITEEDIYTLLDKAVKENKSVILLGHNIEVESKYHHTSPERLDNVLQYGTKIGLDFASLD
ncbi:MAG: polysaccharide deacetylase family protein [Sedimentisphaeraceae bacterium JB056]